LVIISSWDFMLISSGEVKFIKMPCMNQVTRRPSATCNLE